MSCCITLKSNYFKDSGEPCRVRQNEFGASLSEKDLSNPVCYLKKKGSLCTGAEMHKTTDESELETATEFGSCWCECCR